MPRVEERVAQATSLLETNEGRQELAFAIARSHCRIEFLKEIFYLLRAEDNQLLHDYIESFVTGVNTSHHTLIKSVAKMLIEQGVLADFIRDQLPDYRNTNDAVDFWTTLFDGSLEGAQACLKVLEERVIPELEAAALPYPI